MSYDKFENEKSDLGEQPPTRVSISEQSPALTLTWENLNATVKLKKKDGPTEKTILSNVTGIAKPGQLLAIMGASGAGKTTLLNVLTFRNRGKLIIGGDVRINGLEINDPNQLAAVSGYVQQDDLFFGTLKVKEHLKFQAMLRMDKHYTAAEKNERVEEVLQEMNLKKCEDTVIGVPQLGITGISGGEKRRLAFASELIVNPGIMFCDEPTSGLDSFMAMSIVDSMKRLANLGKTIVCTIHQPSSEIFERFDRLFLMAEGRVAYAGDSIMAYDFFSGQGYRCPSNYNPSDYYIKVLAISPGEKEKCEETVKSICEGFESSSFAVDLTTDIRSTLPQAAQPVDAITNAPGYQTSQVFRTNQSSSFKSNSFTQMRWLIWRAFISSSRNPMETRIYFIQNIIIALLFGLIYLRLNYDQEGVQDINGVLFLLITNSSFSNLFSVVNTFPAQVPIFLREHKNRMYRVINFYIAQTLCELPRFIIFPIVFVTIVYWMANLNNDLLRFVYCCCAIILVANSAVAFGSFISAAAPSTNIALALSGPILVPLMIFSGYFLNNDSIPVYFKWLKYLSWLSYANEILITNQWDGVTNITCSSTEQCRFTNGQQVIDFLKMDKDKFVTDLCGLGALILGYRFLAFVSLQVKAARNK